MKAVFLDRDGTLIAEYAKEPWEVKVLPGVEAALECLTAAGYALFVVSNQADVGRGRLSHSAAAAIHGQFLKLLPTVEFTACYYCFHTPEEACPCRKPKPGLIKRALRAYPIDLEHSWLIGDRETDMQCGARAGLQTIRLVPGFGLPAAVQTLLELSHDKVVP